MIDARLEELGIEVPPPSATAANYVPFVRVSALVFISRQIKSRLGKVIRNIIFGVNALTFGVAAEIEALFEVKIL